MALKPTPETLSVRTIGNDTKEQLLLKSAFSLPDNPAMRGMKPKEIKKYLYSAIIDFDNEFIKKSPSVVGIIETLISDTNTAFSNSSTYLEAVIAYIEGIINEQETNFSDELNTAKTELEDKINGVSSTILELNTKIAKQEVINTQQTESIQANSESIQANAESIENNAGEINKLRNAGYITKAVKTLENYYLKTETYSKEEINELHEQLTGLGILFKTVDTLPEVGEEKFIYLLPSTVEENNVYDEYVWINKKWEKIGSTKVNLADYYTKDKIDEKLLNYAKLNDTYTIEQIDEKFNQTNQNIGQTYAKKSALDSKADKSTVYTKEQSDEQIALITEEINNVKDDYVDKTTYQTNQQNVATKSELANKLDATTAEKTYAKKEDLTSKANTSDVYTKNQVYNKNEVYNTSEVDTIKTNLNKDITTNKTAITNLQNAGYITKSVSDLDNYYTKTAVNQLHDDIIGLNIKFEIVTALPTTGIKSNYIYLLPNQSSGVDIYDEYIWIDNKWERIGSTAIDLTQYYKKTEIDNFNSNFTQGIQKNTQDINKINSAGFITKSVDDLLNYYSKSESDNRYVQLIIIQEINDSIEGIITNVNDINYILEERFDDVNLPDATTFKPDIIFGKNGSIYVKTSSYNVELKDDGTLEVVSSTPETGRYVEILDEYESIPITSLAENSFANNSVLFVIDLNKNLTKIGSRAFYNCVGLIKLGLNASITQIGDEVFANCTNLEDVEIGESVAVLGNNMFEDCSSLANITLPELITEIPNSAFRSTGLTEIVVPKNVVKIGESAFRDCRSMTSVTIGESVTLIDDSAFHSCRSLTEVIIPNSVTSIGERAFYDCRRLTEIVIPDSVTSLGAYAFRYCTDITRATIGNGIASIGAYAFDFCSSLTSVTIGESVTIIGNYAFSLCESLTEIVLPNSVTSIGDYAFEACERLSNIIIPNSVTSIGNNAFGACINLTSVTIGNGVTSIGDNAFKACERLSNIIIPNSVTSIGEGAFRNCSGLTSVTISDSVTLISQELFGFCTSLQEVTIPSSVNEISIFAFGYCSNLKNIRIRATIPPIVAKDSSFQEISSDAIFTVPKGTLSSYQSSWSDLYNTYTFVEADE